MSFKSLSKRLCINLRFCLPFQNIHISVVGLLGARNNAWNCPEICNIHNSNIRREFHENVISMHRMISITVYDGLHDFWLTINELVNLAHESSWSDVIDIISPHINYSWCFVWLLLSLSKSEWVSSGKFANSVVWHTIMAMWWVGTINAFFVISIFITWTDVRRSDRIYPIFFHSAWISL